ncbi:MAG TPA: hypothetical protein VFG69_11260 [Nannocystaceae bacterium]|nr:hypothetical protein [Nannocystaceae bacterium]
MGGPGQYTPGQPLKGPARAGPVVSARQSEVKVGRVFFTGELGKVYGLYENADTQPVIDVASGNAIPDSKGKPIVVKCPSWGRGKKLTDQPSTKPGADPATRPAAVCRRASKAILLVELLKHERLAIDGELEVTPKIVDRDGKIVASKLKATKAKIETGTTIAKFIAVDVDLGTLPDTVGRFTLELTFAATPGAHKFTFTPVTTKQHVVCTREAPLDPTKDVATPASDTLSGTHRRMGKLMSLLPASSTDVEDMLWRLYVGINNSTPPNFYNKLAVEITHNGDVKRFFGSGGMVNSGIPFALVEQWLMWTPNTGSPPWNRGACAGYVQLFKTMAATLGLNVRRTLALPATKQMPPAKPGGPKPPPLATSAITVETPMVIAPAGLEVDSKLQKVPLVGLDGQTYNAHPALMEPNQSGEFFEACGVTEGGKYLPGGFSTTRIEQSGVSSWSKGPSGKTGGADWTKAQRGFDSAVDVVRWWTSTKTKSGFQRFMCWVALEDGKLKWCWDVDGKAYSAKDYEKIRDTGKHLPPP